MANFVLSKVTAIGTPIILEDGSIQQQCVVITEIQGIALSGKFLSDNTLFEVPNSVMAGQLEPIISAWNYIKNVLAPQFVSQNYSDVIV